MIVYHGSGIEVVNPNISFSREGLDFGKGFYLTPFLEQAESWALRFKKSTGIGVVSSYELDEKLLRNVKHFNAYDEEWIDFIIACRRRQPHKKYDVIIGGVASDNVFNTIELLMDDLISKEKAIERLRYEKQNSQICIACQALLDKALIFKGSQRLP